jgi:hypothetical protein
MFASSRFTLYDAVSVLNTTRCKISNDDEVKFHYSNGGLHLRPLITSIPDRLCVSRRKLIEVELTASIRIGDHAFRGCSSLRKIHLCEGLRTIGEKSFAGCKQLTHVSVPSTVTVINNGAFHGCTSLEDIHLCEGLLTIGHRALNKHLGVLWMHFSTSHHHSFHRC